MLDNPVGLYVPLNGQIVNSSLWFLYYKYKSHDKTIYTFN